MIKGKFKHIFQQINLTQIVKELIISDEHGRVVTSLNINQTLNVLFSVLSGDRGL